MQSKNLDSSINDDYTDSVHLDFANNMLAN